jgi:SAM-dependent methyltransferase
MNHSDHVGLLQKGVATPGGIWADLGSGSGAFTLALADLLGPGGSIYAVDKDREVLGFLEKGMQIQFPATHLSVMQADFSRVLELPPLDGVVMANSLHFVRKKDEVLQHVRSYLRPGGCLLLVEYNADRGNPWVPYPLSYPSWEKLAQRNGFSEVQLLERVPSRFLGEIYSALNR